MVRADEVKAVIKGPIEQDKPEDLDGLWKLLNSKPAVETTSVAATSTPSIDTVKIKRSYEFAGQLVTYVPCWTILTFQGREGSPKRFCRSKSVFLFHSCLEYPYWLSTIGKTCLSTACKTKIQPRKYG
jgi:hypothetical protein